MNALLVVQIVLLGLLAGEEFIVRWGVQPALSSMPDVPHRFARVALVQRLKVVVPILMIPTVVTSVAVLVVAGGADGLVLRIAGTAALVVFLLASFLGTVPINIGVNDWDPEHPPADWRTVVTRWERIDVLRSTAAGVSFVLFVVGLVVQLG